MYFHVYLIYRFTRTFTDHSSVITRCWGFELLNDPTQFEQVDETCGSGRVVLHLKSLGMTVFFEDIQCSEHCRELQFRHFSAALVYLLR